MDKIHLYQLVRNESVLFFLTTLHLRQKLVNSITKLGGCVCNKQLQKTLKGKRGIFKR